MRASTVFGPRQAGNGPPIALGRAAPQGYEAPGAATGKPPAFPRSERDAGGQNKGMTPLRTWRTLLLAAALLACLPAAVSAEDAVVANVNGTDIKQSDLDFAASEVGAQLANIPPEDRRMMLLQFVIENQLMADAAVKDKLDSGQSFEDRLKYHRRRTLRDAFYDKSVREAVTDAEAKKIYDEKIAGLKPEEEIHARHILVASKEEAEAVAERLKKGEDFATVAKEVSKDPSAADGDLGFFTRGQMLKPFEDAAFALKVDEISEPVQTQFGWHIIEVEEKRTRPLPTFDDVKDNIVIQLTQQKAKDTLRGLHESAKIDIVDPEIKKSMQDAAMRGEASPDSVGDDPAEAEDGQ
jgi:peptidyl-prolyl cis-trans isomerase C